MRVFWIVMLSLGLSGLFAEAGMTAAGTESCHLGDDRSDRAATAEAHLTAVGLVDGQQDAEGRHCDCDDCGMCCHSGANHQYWGGRPEVPTYFPKISGRTEFLNPQYDFQLTEPLLDPPRLTTEHLFSA